MTKKEGRRKMKTSTKYALGLSVMVLLSSVCGAFAATGVAGVDNGIAMVMDADTIAANNGDYINNWSDSSGLGNNLYTYNYTNGWANCSPMVMTNQSDINGHAAVKILTPSSSTDASYADELFTTNGTALTGGALTAFLVFKDYQTYWAPDYPSYGDAAILTCGLGNTAPAVIKNRAANPGTASNSTWNTWQVLMSDGNYIPRDSYGVMTVQYNGANSFAKLNGIVAATGDTSAATLAGNLALGQAPNCTDGRLGGLQIAELVVYNRALTLAEENAVGSTLASKYALTTTYTSVPEPSSLLGLGFAGLGLLLRRRRR
jgi:hypothetical protein